MSEVKGTLRADMPATAALIDQLRAVFGKAYVDGRLISAKQGNGGFYAAEISPVTGELKEFGSTARFGQSPDRRRASVIDGQVVLPEESRRGLGMARDEYINQRMMNWGRWRRGRSGGGLGFATTNWEAFMAEDRYGSGTAAVLPEDEEVITDQAVASLATDVQEALFWQYVEGGSMRAKAFRMGCHERTFRDRVDNGLRLVGRWLSEREEANQAERERVEALQRFASSGDVRDLTTRADKPYLGGDWLARK